MKIFETDLPCPACGYNLRGSVMERGCPECGRKIILTELPTGKGTSPPASAPGSASPVGDIDAQIDQATQRKTRRQRLEQMLDEWQARGWRLDELMGRLERLAERDEREKP